MAHQIIMNYFHNVQPYFNAYGEHFIEMVLSIWVLLFIGFESMYLFITKGKNAN